MTQKLGCIGIIIDLKFIYHREEYSTLLVLRAILVVYFYKVQGVMEYSFVYFFLIINID